MFFFCFFQHTPLHWAATHGSNENVKLLIKNGANVLIFDEKGKTPLHWAAINPTENAKSCVQTIINAAPTSINWQDFEGVSALHLAVFKGSLEIIDTILSTKHFDLEQMDNQFRTALFWACCRLVIFCKCINFFILVVLFFLLIMFNAFS